LIIVWRSAVSIRSAASRKNEASNTKSRVGNSRFTLLFRIFEVYEGSTFSNIWMFQMFSYFEHLIIWIFEYSNLYFSIFWMLEFFKYSNFFERSNFSKILIVKKGFQFFEFTNSFRGFRYIRIIFGFFFKCRTMYFFFEFPTLPATLETSG